MRFATLKDGAVAAVQDGMFAPIAPNVDMLDLIARFGESNFEYGRPIPVNASLLAPPLRGMSKIWAAASNYRRGSAGLEEGRGRGDQVQASPQEVLEMAFLKPPSAIVGPGDSVIIPKGAQTIFPELELCVVMGKTVREVPRARAMDAVFGYTIILDVTARGYGSGGLIASRCVRKGFDTFAPIGPWIVTRDEIPDPQALRMRLWVNGELRQSAATDAMINGVVDLVSYLSIVSTLHPGDLIATGNPDSPAYQEQLKPGDELRAEIEGIGEMILTVR